MTAGKLMCFNLCALLLLISAILTSTEGGSIPIPDICPENQKIGGKCREMADLDTTSTSTESSSEKESTESGEVIDTDHIDFLLSKIFGTTTAEMEATTMESTTANDLLEDDSTDFPIDFYK